MNRWTAIFISVLGVGIISVAALHFFGPTPKVQVSDRLCDFVRNDQKMECVAVLASDTFVRPGSVVDYQASAANPDRVPLPNADLFSPACYVPGADTSDITHDFQPQPISIPTFSYEVNRALETGGDVEVPRLDNIKLTAGPKWSDVSKIELTADEAWAVRLDENLAVKAVKSCQIRKSCVDRILSERYRVIGTTIVAKGLTYKVYGKDGRLITLQGGATSGEFTVKAGSKSDVTTTTDATVKTSQGRVLGLRLMPPSVFLGQPICVDDVVFTADGRSKIFVFGGREKNVIVNSDSKFIGSVAAATYEGNEQNPCVADSEIKRSRARITARVLSTEPGVVTFDTAQYLQGGQFVTETECVTGEKSGGIAHDTTVFTTIEMTGTILATVRSESPSTLVVTYSDADNMSLRVLDWHNRLVAKADGELPDDAAGYKIKGNGSIEFPTIGAGVYRIEGNVSSFALVMSLATVTQSSRTTLRAGLREGVRPERQSAKPSNN